MSPLRIIRLVKSVLLNQSFSEQHFYDKHLHKRFLTAFEQSDAVLLTASSLVHYLPIPDQSSKIIIMDFMDVDSDKWLQYANSSSALHKFVYTREAKKIAKLEQEAIKRCHTCFVISNQERDLLKNIYGKSAAVEVLSNGIDQQLFNPVWIKPDDTINFLFSGVMDYKPNIDAVLWFVKHCWPSITSNNKARFTIAGMSPKPEIQKLADDPTIEVTGFVEDIKPYFDRAHIFIAPFRIARGVQNKVLQAMACGLPVVSTSLGAEGIQCTDQKDIFIADSYEVFISSVLHLMENADLRANIGKEAVRTIDRHYGWPSVLSPLTSLLGNHEE